MTRTVFFISSFLAILGCGVLVLLAQPGGQPFPLTVAASSMKMRSDVVRKDFVSQHLDPQRDYPLVTMFHAASMLPSNKAIAVQLLNRGGGVFKVTKIDQNHARLTNSGTGPLNVPFTALLEGQNLRILVAVPKDLYIDAEWSADTLSIKPAQDSPLRVTFIDLPSPSGTPIGISVSQQVDSLAVSPTAVILTSRSQIASGRGLRLTLDLTATPTALERGLRKAILALFFHEPDFVTP